MNFMLDGCFGDDINDEIKSVTNINYDSALDNVPILPPLLSLEAGNIFKGKFLNKLTQIYVNKLTLDSDNLKLNINHLQQEIEKLEERKQLNDLEIIKIKNRNLKERFIHISDNFMAEMLKKKLQVNTNYF